MTREIKFRAWNTRVKRKAMEYFTLTDIYWRGEETGEYEFPSEKTPIMQYTGLKDKQGKEIYEGDICRINTKGAFPPYGNPDSEELTNIAILAVEWWNGQFVFNANRYKYLDNGGDDYINFGWWVRSNEHKISLKQIEVIGNIYENPELLKEENVIP